MLGVFVRALMTFTRRRTRHDASGSRTGTVTVIQRAGSAANLNVHFHTIAIDGVFLERRWERSILDGPEALESFAAERRAQLADAGLERLRAIGLTRVVRAGRDDSGTWLEIDNASDEPLAADSLAIASGPPWELPGVPLRGPDSPVAPGAVGRFVSDEPLAEGLVLVTLATDEREADETRRLADLLALPPLEPGAVWER